MGKGARLSAASVYSGFSIHRLRSGLGHDLLGVSNRREQEFHPALGPPTALAGIPEPASATSTSRPTAAGSIPLSRTNGVSPGMDPHLCRRTPHDRYSGFGGTTNPRRPWSGSAPPTSRPNVLRLALPRLPSSALRGVPTALGKPATATGKIRLVEASLTWQPLPAIQTTLSLFRPRTATSSGRTQPPTSNARQRGRREFAWIPGNASGSAAITPTRRTSTKPPMGTGLAPTIHAYARADWQFHRRLGPGEPPGQLVADRQRAPRRQPGSVPRLHHPRSHPAQHRAWSAGMVPPPSAISSMPPTSGSWPPHGPPNFPVSSTVSRCLAARSGSKGVYAL